MPPQRFPATLVLATLALIFSAAGILGDTTAAPLTTGLIIIQALSVIMSPIHPRICSATYIMAFLSALLAGHSTGLELFLGVLLLTVIAATGYYLLSVQAAAIITLGGFYSPVGTHFEFDLVALVVFLTIAALAYLLGFWIHRYHQQHQQTQRTQQACQKQFTSLLHDTIAADLTSLTVQLEKLAIITPQRHDELKRAAHIARGALSCTRQLLDTLNTQPGAHPTSGLPSLLGNLSQRLRDHGFNVTTTTNLATSVSMTPHNTALERVLSEAVTNIIKHTTAHSDVTINAISNEQGVTLTITNAYASTKNTCSSTMNFGLTSMSHTLHAVGGRLKTHSDGHEWVTEAHIPFS